MNFNLTPNGSYPYMKLADEAGVSYRDVLLCSQVWQAMHADTPRTPLPHCVAAMNRLPGWVVSRCYFLAR